MNTHKRLSHTKRKKKSVGFQIFTRVLWTWEAFFYIQKGNFNSSGCKNQKGKKGGGGKPVLQNILCFPTLAQQAVVSTDLSEHSVKIIPTSNLSGLSAPEHGIVEIFIFHSDKKMPKIAHCLPRFSREEGPLVLWKCTYTSPLLVCTPVEIATQSAKTAFSHGWALQNGLPGCCARHAIVGRERHCCRETSIHWNASSGAIAFSMVFLFFLPRPYGEHLEQRSANSIACKPHPAGARFCTAHKKWVAFTFSNAWKYNF